MKLIFLDIDGVMNNIHRSTVMLQKNYSPSGFDPTAVGLLKKLLIETEARIVICSTWRICIGKTKEWWNGLFSAYGFDYTVFDYEVVVGLTPKSGSSRGNQVSTFIENFEEKVDSYVILDDDSDYFTNQPFIKVDSGYGLNYRNVEDAKEILGRGVSKGS